MAKIAMIGAGSIVFAKNLIVDILSFPELSGSTISLMDIDEGRLDMISKLAHKVVAQEGFNATIEATTDRRQALEDANYVILMIQVGGVNVYEYDVAIPMKYGIKQAVGDTLGPGGVFRALRTIPVFLDICKDIEELCPDALILNYVNPMAMNCWALNAATNIKNVGLCHSVQGTSEDIARYIGAPYEEISYKCAGINHMAWFLEYKWNGKDAYPLIKEKYNDPAVYNQDITKFEFLKHFGYFVTESSYHMSEYVPYFRKKDAWIDKIKGIDSWLKDDEGSYLHRCQRLASTFYEDMNKIVDANKVEVNRTHEYGAYIIHAIETGTPTVINGNVENKGLITNLPQGCVVEVPCLVNKNGIQPTVIGELPPQLAALNRTNINVQELAVKGCLAGDKELIYNAIMTDPLTSTILDMDEIRAMVDEMFEAEKDYLPQFK
ncbi:alpha-glucosidase/alpha-galactosidase [Petroclostridium xylanilyticum]|jgi:alpha-galactosidase|uniref:alpha-glucosidase/alpha-galactosidase n=1 Tax=Petroclostridium xylanilyticum TaxID=1792311 RepID=UPI000B98F07A|nr:alpha-glucosidase/alpha-galactosidase [Petroclostridium xylanilyticum]